MKVLLCEICREAIGQFDPEELSGNPINLQAVKSLYPDRHVPAPFPAALDNWDAARCPRCRRRPFFNFTLKGDGTVIVATGDPVPDGGQWYVIVQGDSGAPEKMLLSTIIKPITPPEPQTEELPIIIDDEEEPAGSYRDLPVLCPDCGKMFRSIGRLKRYHTPCPYGGSKT